jgi:hypothetical protein
MYKWVKKKHFLSMHCLLSKKTPKSIIKPRVNPLVSLCLKWRNEFCRVVTIAPQNKTILSDYYIVYFLKHVLKKKSLYPFCIHFCFCSMETTHLILHQGVCSYDEEFYIINCLLTIVFLILLLVGSLFYSKLLIYRNRLSLNSAIGSNIFFIINDFSSVFVIDF